MTEEVVTAAESPEPQHSEMEQRLIAAYKNAGKIRSSSAQKVFLERFIPQMEEKLGLAGFVADEVKEIIKEDPVQANNIVALMKNAQRRMKEDARDAYAFSPQTAQPQAEPEFTATQAMAKSNYRVQAALKIVKSRVKDLGRLRGLNLEILKAALSDSLNEDEINEVILLLGV